MKILAIDTSSFPASVAIAEDNVILGEYVIRNQRKHSQNIMVMTKRLLGDLDIDVSEIDIFAVTVGPGSFTGLRIGISTIRAFAQAMNKPVVAVNTLEALAYNMQGYKGAIIPMLDARRNEVFTAAYEFCGEELKTVIEPCVMTIEENADRFHGVGAMLNGDGAIIHRGVLENVDGFEFPLQNLLETRASAVASLAFLRADKSINYNEVQPLYLRKSQAEREYDGREKNDSNR